MSAWKTRGLRGSVLEDIVNFTNDRYKQQGLALLQKIATPITPVKINPENGNITLAYFEQHSTVDYIGVAQGIPICFDAKETALKNLPLKNVHEHQIQFMQDFAKHNGVAFLIVYFTNLDEYYLLPIEILLHYKKEADNGGRKSIPYDAFQKKYRINKKGNGILHYLETVDVYLQTLQE